MKNILPLVLFILLIGCEKKAKTKKLQAVRDTIDLPLTEANRLADLPLACIQKSYPYKSGLIISKASDLKLPVEHHPAFYGCFDWHSAVHGHWSLVYLLKTFPNLAKRATIISFIDKNLTAENIQKEVAYFRLNVKTKSFERTYGWAWVLKLQEELFTWKDVKYGKKWYSNLKPLSDHIVKSYINYLPKLLYPIRGGQHSNTAFGLSFAYDYAKTVNDIAFLDVIKTNAIRFFKNDKNYPITWEPSGYDFLSPCLQELDLMRKVLSKEAFNSWLFDFLPAIKRNTLTLMPGKVSDRSDGKLVHLDGLNFSRAWCLFPLKGNKNAQNIANNHLKYSLKKIIDGDYAGQHWLGSFALYALKIK